MFFVNLVDFSDVHNVGPLVTVLKAARSADILEKIVGLYSDSDYWQGLVPVSSLQLAIGSLSEKVSKPITYVTTVIMYVCFICMCGLFLFLVTGSWLLQFLVRGYWLLQFFVTNYWLLQFLVTGY